MNKVRSKKPGEDGPQLSVVRRPAPWDDKSQAGNGTFSSGSAKQDALAAVKTQTPLPSPRGYATPPATPLPPLSVASLHHSVADGPPESDAASMTQSRQSFFGKFQQQCDLAGPDGALYCLFPTLSASQFTFHAPTASWISYRRNFFSLTVSLPDLPPPILFTLSDPSPVSHLELSIAARTTPNGTTINLLQLDSARDFRKAPPALPQRLIISDPPSSSSSPAADSEEDPVATAGFSRLQFARSTANHRAPSSGSQAKRFIVSVVLTAVRANGTVVEIGRWTSEPLIVRGRSPKNFVRDPPSVGQLSHRSTVGESAKGFGEKKARSSCAAARIPKPGLAAKFSPAGSSRAGKTISWDDYEPGSLGVGRRTRSRDQRTRKDSTPMETVVEEDASDGD